MGFRGFVVRYDKMIGQDVSYENNEKLNHCNCLFPYGSIIHYSIGIIMTLLSHSGIIFLLADATFRDHTS